MGKLRGYTEVIMNFKQKIMGLGFLGLIIQSMIASDLPVLKEGAGACVRQVPNWVAYPYYFGEDLCKAGGQACGHMGTAFGHVGSAFGETWEATKKARDFACEYPVGSLTTVIVATIVSIWASLYVRNLIWGSDSGRRAGSGTSVDVKVRSGL